MADKSWLTYGLICALGAPRYFTSNGVASSFKSAEYRKHLAAVAKAGANSVRHLPYGGVWWPHPNGKLSQFSPFKYVSEATGWDLSKWDESFFDLMRDIIEIENSLNLTTFYCLSDNCEYSGDYKKFSPWVSNKQGITKIYEPAAWPYFKAFIQKCQSEFAGLDVLWPTGNEMNNPLWRNTFSGPQHTHAYGAVFPLIESGALVPTRMTYGATMQDIPYISPGIYENGILTIDWVKADVGNEFGDPVKLAIIKEIHGCGKNDVAKTDPEYPHAPYGHRVEQAVSWWGRSGQIRKLFSDDGTKLKPGERGASLVDKEPDGAKPSAQFWHDMMTYIYSRCVSKDLSVNFEHLPQIDTDAVQVPVWTAISTAYYEKFGAWPKNYGGGISPTTGSLTVTLAPAGAISAGAQWKVDGGSWNDSAATVSGLTTGNHTVYYKATAGYTSPVTVVVAILSSQETTATGTYVLSSDTGSIKVTITPAGAVSAGAKWYVDDATERASGATVSGLTVGNHAVSFKTVSLYTSPGAISVPVEVDVTTTLTDEAIYVLTAATGSLTVTLLPAGAVTAGAHWNIDGGTWQDSGATESDLELGAHTVGYQETVGYTAPVSETVTIT